jgi:ribosomal protein S6--L-glutamate ligase
MKIGILAKKHHVYSHQRLVEAGTKRGHDMRLIDTSSCYMNISASAPEIHYRGGEVIRGLDAVIPRVGPLLTLHGTSVVRQFEMMNVYTVNSSLSISRARDKLRSLQYLVKKGIPIPTTGFAYSPDDTEDLIDMVGGPPLIIKLLEGTQGQGIVIAETRAAARSVISAFKQLRANILVQEFIKEAEGTDLRCLVVGKRVVASMMRVAKVGEFRANIHQGGRAEKTKISKEETAMAVAAAKAMGLNIAGVDLIRSTKGPLVLEVNSSPGLEGIEKASGVDVASKMIEFIEKAKRK